MNDPISDSVVRVLKGLNGYPPESLVDEVNHRLRKSGEKITDSDLVDLVTSSDPNEPARVNYHIQLTRWDTAEPAEWSNREDGSLTLPGTPARRERVLAALELTAFADAIGAVFPVGSSDTVVIAEEPEDWDPWYTPERAAEHHFYWDAYSRVLSSKLDEYALSRLDDVTSRIVSRLADPARSAPYQSKGLVVGHVQSGKTANFTGVVAKAIDAGYRLVIVLTGTIEILRSQTQRRLDMELVGEENILGGIDPKDAELIADVDYAGSGDRDWVEGRFVKHGVRPRTVNEPEIQRLTRASWDYKALAAGLSALDFRSGNELKDHSKPLYDPVNLFGTDVRIAVVKKNARVLERLVSDLKRIHTHLAEIPVLIIDDEADQASVNTKKDRKTKEEKERTAINKLIAQILGQLKRAQYVGYTATPFANVFVDPDDAEDIFPRDFIVSLEPPAVYMGGRDFHDLDLAEDDERTYATSNEKAYVRDLRADPDDESKRRIELQAAIDAFVLTGAVKLWREAVGQTPGRFRHHTMLIHESVRQSEHTELARLVHDVWKRAGYSSGTGLRRLHDLWRDDVLPVSEARAAGEPVPRDFADLRQFIGQAVDRISTGSSPIVVVNGDKDSDYQQKDLDFQTGDVWKILIGGTKLSRGFTVEGLTVSYYTRRTSAADTLMQMGRWFGYRSGYRDLVRLYVGRNVPGPRNTRVDLYEVFEAVVRDEEDFRAELRAFQGLHDDGRPKVRPIEVPPMVFQSLPWMRPTAANKMYNAELTFKGAGGQVKDFFQQPRHSAGINRSHYATVHPLLDALTLDGTFFNDHHKPYGARVGLVDAEVLRKVLDGFRWNDKFDFGPTLQFFDQAVSEGTLKDWVVFLPILSGNGTAQRRIGARDETYTILTRTRRQNRDGVFSGSSPRQRLAMQIISGGVDPLASSRNGGVARNPALRALEAAGKQYPDAIRLHEPTRGAFLLSFAADDGQGSNPGGLPDPADPGDVATLFSLAFPKKSAPTGRVGFSVRVKRRSATVSRGETGGEAAP
jgi:hypothetical protein